MDILTYIEPWLTLRGQAVSPARLLDIGCGTAVEAEPLLATGLIAEFMGVDLDETAVSQAQSRLPQATFICADAATLDGDHSYDLILIRRPDLLAQPDSWQRIFANLNGLLTPSGRIIVTVIGEGEAAMVRRWLAANHHPIAHEETLPMRDETTLFVADAVAQKAPSPLKMMTFDFAEGEGMYCDPLTGLCVTPELENTNE